MKPILITAAEAATMLGVCRNRVYELIYSEQIASVKLGRSRRIPLSELQRFVDESIRKAA